MCNFPCELCADSDDCELYFNQLKILLTLNEVKKDDCEPTEININLE